MTPESIKQVETNNDAYCVAIVIRNCTEEYAKLKAGDENYVRENIFSFITSLPSPIVSLKNTGAQLKHINGLKSKLLEILTFAKSKSDNATKTIDSLIANTQKYL